MATSMSFEFGFGAPERAGRAEDGQPLRLLVLGDFSGRASRGLADAAGLGQRPVRRIDLDNFERTIAQVAPAVQVTVDGAAALLGFAELDDFHPDQLYRKADIFDDLRSRRAQLNHPATFAAASAQLQAGGDAGAAAIASATPAPAAAATSDADAFASLLGGEVKRPAPAALAAGGLPDINTLIKNLIGALPAGADPRQAEFVAAADTVIGERMRALLHAPAFQQLEAAWRGVRMLVGELELDEQLQLHIVDVSKAELLADIDAAGDALHRSGLYQLLVERPRRAADGAPWSVLTGNYSFGDSADDVRLLAALGAIAAQAGAPFIGAAQDSLAGAATLAGQPDPTDWAAAEPDAAARWQALRASAQAGWIGLALPRMLLRLPYGKATDRIEQFDFEEMRGTPEHGDYLWGAASFGCALLLGRAFQDSGWAMSPGDALDLDGLPAHIVRRDGEAHMQACAEAYLSERAGEALLRRGLMPLLSFKNRPAARLLRSQSIADPARALSGGWD